MGLGDFFINNCYRGNYCKFWEATPIADVCKHPKCKGLGSGEQNEINREIAKKCVKEKLYAECEEVEG